MSTPKPPREALQRLGADVERWAKTSTPAMTELGRQMREIIKKSFLLPVSRELALEWGLVEPTPEERAEMERLAAEAERERAEREARMDHEVADITVLDVADEGDTAT